MDTRKLLFFHYVATYQNFTKAAEECHIAQTAMSRTIAGLEQELGFALFDRSHKRATLTPAGKAFWEKTRRILDLYQNAVTESIDIANGLDHQLSVGYGGFERQLVVRYTEGFLESFPNTSVVIYYSSYDEMVSNLLTGKYDVVFGPANRLGSITNLRQEETYVSSYYLAVSTKNPLAASESVEAERLEGTTLVCPSEKGVYQDQVYEKLCRRLGFQPGKILHTNSVQSLLVTVELDRAMAIVPDYLRRELRGGVALRPFARPLAPEKVHVAAGFDVPDKQIVGRFLDYVIQKRPEIRLD